MVEKLKVYTAGGFHGDWRERINKILAEKFIVLDPFSKEFDSSKGERKHLSYEEYTVWDLWAIRTADIVFVYSQRTNPGQGYIVEAGYAKGLGKTVILVREENNEHMPDKYLNFIDCVADFVCHDFNEGVEFLTRLSL
jgi:nucleoside 2-deoxyribosyltransferase